MIKTVYENQTEILSAIQTLHCPEGFKCDATFGNGCFWKDIKAPDLKFDITPIKEGVIEADSAALPLSAGSLDNIVFDPPFLTYVKNGRGHKDGSVAMSKRFGGYYTYEDLEDHYRDSISEAYRVLKPAGKMVFKCQDIIHNHKMHCTHLNVVFWAEIEGFRLLDLFVLVAKHRMPGPQKGIQRHARIWHSYFLVLQRDKGGSK